MLGSTFIRIYFHAYVYLFEYFNSRNINITPASMCSCPCCRILVMIHPISTILHVFTLYVYIIHVITCHHYKYYNNP